MKHIRITQPGWEGYNGLFCDMNFVDGVSEEIATQRMVDRCAALLQVEQIEVTQGAAEVVTPVGLGARIEGNLQKEAEVLEPMQRAEDEAPAPVSTPAPEPLQLYTEAELQTIADEQGIKGLRVIGDKLSVKGRAIPEIVREILEAQSKIETLRANDAEIAAQAAATVVETERG